MNSCCHSNRLHGGALKKVLISLVVLVVVSVLAWMLFLPTIVKSQVKSHTGFPVEASTISVNPFGARVLLEGFHIHNPAEFPNPAFVDLKRLDLQVKPFSLLGDRVDLPRIDVDIDKVTIVTDAKGVTNVTLFGQNLQGQSTTTSQPSGGTKTSTPTKPFLIGELHLRVATVETMDYSRGATPVTRTINIGIDRTFTNVSDPKVIVGPILTDLARANLGGLTGGIPGLDLLANELKGAGGESKDLGSKAANTLKKLFDSVRGTGKP